MSDKANLLHELDGLLAAGQGEEVLGRWLFKNREMIRDALSTTADLVMIQKVDLNDPRTWPAASRPAATEKAGNISG